MDSAGWMEWVARLLEWVGVGVIIVGAALATGKFLVDLRAGGQVGAYDRYRANLGRGILLGLLITGRSATLPAGSELRGEVRTDASLPAIQR